MFVLFQVHAVLLPGKKQKQKSKVRQGDNPQFMESFLFRRITPGKMRKIEYILQLESISAVSNIRFSILFAEDVNNLSVRFRLYGRDRMRRHRLIGECIVSFSNVNLQMQSNIWVPLEPRANTVVSTITCTIYIGTQS